MLVCCPQLDPNSPVTETALTAIPCLFLYRVLRLQETCVFYFLGAQKNLLKFSLGIFHHNKHRKRDILWKSCQRQESREVRIVAQSTEDHTSCLNSEFLLASWWVRLTPRSSGSLIQKMRGSVPPHSPAVRIQGKTRPEDAHELWKSIPCKRWYLSALADLLWVGTNNEWHLTVILFSPWGGGKNAVVYKVFSCFNTQSIPLYGDGENVWDWPGRGGCVGKTFQSEKWCLTFKGLIAHIPLASNRITSHVGAACVFREEVVWFYDSCCHHCRWRNATLQEFMALMTLSCITYVYVNSQLCADAFEHVSTRKKNKICSVFSLSFQV